MKTIPMKKYLEQGGVNCPRCGGGDFDCDAFEIDVGAAWQSVWCTGCYLSWTEHYKLTGISAVYCLDTDKEVSHDA